MCDFQCGEDSPQQCCSSEEEQKQELPAVIPQLPRCCFTAWLNSGVDSTEAQHQQKSPKVTQHNCESIQAIAVHVLNQFWSIKHTQRKKETQKDHLLHLSLLQDKVDPEQLTLLLKTEWKLSYVTPLYQFRHTQLKSYSRQLSAFIAAEKQQGLAVDAEGSQSSFRVSFSVVQGMTEMADDAETVLIQVSTGFC